jgi:hypothetical protein
MSHPRHTAIGRKDSRCGTHTAARGCTRLSECASRIIVAHLVGAPGRKRIEADMITGPAWTLEGRAFSAAISTTCAGAQFVARSILPPQDEGDRARQRRVMLAALTPEPDPRRCSL